MRYRWIVIPVAALVIAALCAYKLNQRYPDAEQRAADQTLLQPAPQFSLLDANKPSQFVRLGGYLGRHRIIVVFFDGAAGADHDSILLHLRDVYPALKSAGTIVFAVSTALPQDNRKVIERSGEFPFPLLSDPDFSAHEAWGRFDARLKQPLTGVFFIDRKGEVAGERGMPRPLADPMTVVNRLLEGE